MVGPNSMRQGIGSELWINLPQQQRDKVPKPSAGDAVAPCGLVMFKSELRKCPGTLDKVMCQLCKGKS